DEDPTGLHWAALGGHAAVVSALLRRGAPVDAQETTYGATPLGWALYAWGNEPEPPAERFAPAATRRAAGANVEPEWLARPKVQADPEMLAALSGGAEEDSTRASPAATRPEGGSASRGAPRKA